MNGWKEGDWCFYEWKLAQVKKVEPDGRVTDISNGYITSGSYDLRDCMFPLSLRGIYISGEYEHHSDKLHRHEFNRALNFPDIKRWLVQEWAECMESLENDEHVRKYYERLHEFTSEIISTIEGDRSKNVHGVHVYR